MALSELQHKRLIKDINTLPIKTILPSFVSREITLDEVPNIDPERRKHIEEQLLLMPNPKEQKEWAEIEKLLSDENYDSVLQKLNDYVRNWESSRPAENHVDEAMAEYNRIDVLIRNREAAREENDWNAVNTFNKFSLMEYLKKYPKSVHKDEIDDTIWNNENKESVGDIQEYIDYFPQGLHTAEAKALLAAIIAWEQVRVTNDIFVVYKYIQENGNSPYKQQAELELMKLKQYEKAQMKNYPKDYDVSRLMKLLELGIFSENELIYDHILTPGILETLRNTDIVKNLPDIKHAITSSQAECISGYTDVYFFGVPSTGKTCVLMGLSRSDSLNINLTSGGGDYAAALQQYTDVGITVPRTPGNFVTALEAKISSADSADSIHQINLVEMSGEEFAVGIADNPEHIFTFEDMGSGATRLLSNDNRKVFFLIIDPTADVIRSTREIDDGVDEEGNTKTRLDYYVVNQRILLQKMVNILERPENAEIMRKVDSIHIIMTKSDTLGNTVEREENALKIFNSKFGNKILTPLIDVCKEYNINAKTNFHPKLYTFSLGTFYVGGLYEYINTDSNRLVKAIRNSTQRTKKKTFGVRVKEYFNK